MSLPGWYPDPSGAPGRFRHWDGATWSAQTTDDPTIPPPVGAGGMASTIPAPPPQRPRWPAILGAVVAVVLIAAAVIAMWRLTAGDVTLPDGQPSDNTAAPPTAGTDPTPGPSGSPSQVAPSCINGYGSIDAPADVYTTGGIAYDAVDGWGFRFDRTTWGWIDDVAAWGTLNDDEYASGIVIGGLSTSNGFYDLPQAAQATVDCLAGYGVFSDQTYEWNLTGATADVDGMPAYLLRGEVTSAANAEFAGYALQVVVIDVGELDRLATWVSFHPVDDQAYAALIDEAYSSLRRA